MLGWLALPLLAAGSTAFAARECAATPEGAVLQALGERTSGKAGTGFRVRDMVFDPLLGRAFVQVENCEHPDRPLVSLPFVKARQQQEGTGLGTLLRTPPRKAEPDVRSGTLVAVAMGDEHTHMTVRGHLLASAAIGSDVEVELVSLTDGASQPGGSAKHVHGRLASADRVEVQP